MGDPLIDQILNMVERLIESGEQIPDEVIREITSIIQDHLTREEPQQEPPPQQPQLPSPEEPETPQQPTVAARPIQFPPGADLLWLLSGGQPEAFVSYLRSFPGQGFDQLLRNPDQLQNLIVQFQNNNPINRNQTSDGVDQSSLQSSTIWGSRFDPKTNKLRVKFQGGSVYDYDNVPPMIAQLFMQGSAQARTNGQNRHGRWWRGKQPSAGAALNQLIKQGGYDYHKVR